jgi:hypothetical protein
MAIDTAAKRVSALRKTLPLPDGALSQPDRQHVLWQYTGILAIELILYLVVYGRPSLGPWIVSALPPAVTPWIAVETAALEDLTP